MTTDEWNALLNKLTEAWEQFAVTVRQAADTLAIHGAEVVLHLYPQIEKHSLLFAVRVNMPEHPFVYDRIYQQKDTSDIFQITVSFGD